MSTQRQTHTPPPRPTTPLRPSSRTSTSTHPYPSTHTNGALDSLTPQLAELSDSLIDLESNLLHLQLMHESLGRFSENFAAFLYGLEMNAFVVDWPEQPLVESVGRWKGRQQNGGREQGEGDGETTMGLGMGMARRKSVDRDGGVDDTLVSETTFASVRAVTPKRRGGAGAGAGFGRGAGRGFGTRQGRGGTSAGTGAGARGGADANRGGLPARSGSAAGNLARGGRGSRGSGLPTRGRGRGVR